MNAVAILVIIVSGFLYTSKNPLARFKQARSSGWDSYFHVTTWGVLFAFASGVVCLFMDAINAGYWLASICGIDFDQLKSNISIGPKSVKLTIWAAFSMLIAQIFGWLSDNRENIEKALVLIAEENDFERILLEAATQQLLVQVTMSTNKVYIGFPFEQASTKTLKSSAFITLFPVLSGYRDKDTLSMNLVTSYTDFYRKAKEDGSWEWLRVNFQTVIPVSEIVTIAFFDLNAHDQIKSCKPEKKRADQQPEPAHQPSLIQQEI